MTSFLKIAPHAFRLEDAVVRAGFNSNHLLNPEIGRVSSDQANSRAVVDFTPEPYVTARYVSVSIIRSGADAIVQLTEVMVEEGTTKLKDALPTALNLAARPSSQISSFTDQSGIWDADRAVDGVLQYVSPYCSRTNVEQNPWWKIDLTSFHCISKIAIRNIDDLEQTTRLNLEHAVARAGLSATSTGNAMCGSPVTQYQALINDWIEFVCDPSRLARYVSINIPGEAALILCEVIVLQCDLQPQALNMTEKPTNQSSTINGQDAGRAFDGLPEEPFCSVTDNEENPWWRVDLESSYCLGIIQVRNTGSPTEPNLQDAVVRAGLNEVHTNNIMCGTPVTSDQSVINDWIEFACDPPVLARYVSVDIPGTTIFKLCEVTVSTCDFHQRANAVEFTVVANPAVLGDIGHNDSSITAYKGAGDTTSGVLFGRQLPTGGTSNDPPSGSVVLADPSTGCADKLVLRLPGEDGLNRTGVFFSEMISDDITTRVQVVILNKGNNIHVRPVQRTQTANIGESVMLQMHDVNSPSTDYRWRHNGGDIIEPWNNLLNVSIPNVAVESEGIYACFALGQEHKQLHGVMRLIVRGCPSGLWDPPSCLRTCPRCYNGGVCNDKSGTCVCPPGFSGNSCEQAHGRHVFGKMADQRCSPSTDAHHDACRGRLFCLPDPYGCSCAAGYKGLDCMQDCNDGTFGADCKQTCHCAAGGTCSKDTGECSMGCMASYLGSNCQCSTQNGVIGLEVTSGDPHQLFVTWQPDPCAFGYEFTTRDECEDIISQELISENGYHFVSGLASPLSHRVYIRPMYSDDERGPEVTFPRITKPTLAPVDVNLNSATPYSLSFSWSKPPCGSRGGIIIGYTYKLTEVSPESQAVIQSVTSEESVTFEDLTPLTEYSFQVAANTIAGAGPRSQAEVETTLRFPASSSLAWGAAVAVVILILLAVIVVIVVYKRRSHAQRGHSNVRGDTPSQKTKRTLELDVSYQVPKPTQQPAPYACLGDGVISIQTQIKVNGARPDTSQTSESDPSAYAIINDTLAEKSTSGVAALSLKPKHHQKPAALPQPAAEDDTYEVPESGACSCIVAGEFEMPSAPSDEPYLVPSTSQPAREGDSREQWKQQSDSQISAVDIDKLAEYIHRKERAGQNGFPADFKTLPDGQLHPATAAMKPHNKAKNFSVGLFAYDHSRVVLEPLESDPHSDYINASYVDAYSEKDKYIATQGPTESTVDDFWRMVWQLNVDKIIMLTNLKESFQQYWPHSGFTNYSDTALRIIKEEHFADYTIRVFKINKFFSAEGNRLVTQFHFNAWLGMKPPEYPSILLNFMRMVNTEPTEGRTIVHCSNGIGRTGTYIALDSMLDQMQKERRVDVLGFIYRMRQKRINMVQTLEQYRFIFDALLEVSKAGEAEYVNIKKGAKKRGNRWV
ncbi:uncharacterized protein LOC110981618 [Acanthaster planci]|uniref:protein-tyrosine-phosphatase n=1 Tax=Acanthaster planci TaxID=133434 RepID=A0A8B7YQR7_ACAPL|nr:uncharacterized protein LOC110981618 [Acanthaster planci]